MTRAHAVPASLLFTIVPGTVAGLVPWLLTNWQRSNDFPDPIAVRLVGGVLIALGLPVLLHAIFRFAVEPRVVDREEAAALERLHAVVRFE